MKYDFLYMFFLYIGYIWWRMNNKIECVWLSTVPNCNFCDKLNTLLRLFEETYSVSKIFSKYFFNFFNMWILSIRLVFALLKLQLCIVFESCFKALANRNHRSYLFFFTCIYTMFLFVYIFSECSYLERK